MNKAVEYLSAQIGKENAESPSPVFSWLKGIFREIAPGKASVDYLIRKEMCNPVGIIHGGTVALIADETIGIAVACSESDYHFVTINLSTNYLSSAKEGEYIRAEAEVIRKGNKIIYAECNIYNSEGKLLSKSNSNLGISNIKKTY